MSIRALFASLVAVAVAGCGVIYTAPDVKEGAMLGAYDTDFDVEVVPLTYETASAANLEPYVPARLPLAFQPGAAKTLSEAAGAGAGSLRSLPEPTARPLRRPAEPPAERLPPPGRPEPYRIGVADVVVLSINEPATLETLPGLLSAQAKRQGYVVQDDGAIAIPDVGRVKVAGLTLSDAEAEIFQALVSAGIDPSFSLEIAEFNSQRVAVGGMVAQPSLVPITLKPLYLYEALDLAGGVPSDDPESVVVRLYRNGNIYRIPLRRLLDDPRVRHTVLRDGDSIHVGSVFREAEAIRHFEEQLRLRAAQMQDIQFRLQMEELRTRREELAAQRLAAERQLFRERLELGAVERHYAYRAGEVRQPGRVALPFERSMSLADVLFSDDGGGMSIGTADYGQIYVLRAPADPARRGALTAYHLDAENAANLAAATMFEIRPNDIVFVAEQPVTSWNRALNQILPSLFINTATRVGGL